MARVPDVDLYLRTSRPSRDTVLDEQGVSTTSAS